MERLCSPSKERRLCCHGQGQPREWPPGTGVCFSKRQARVLCVSGAPVGGGGAGLRGFGPPASSYVSPETGVSLLSPSVPSPVVDGREEGAAAVVFLWLRVGSAPGDVCWAQSEQEHELELAVPWSHGDLCLLTSLHPSSFPSLPTASCCPPCPTTPQGPPGNRPSCQPPRRTRVLAGAVEEGTESPASWAAAASTSCLRRKQNWILGPRKLKRLWPLALLLQRAFEGLIGSGACDSHLGSGMCGGAWMLSPPPFRGQTTRKRRAAPCPPSPRALYPCPPFYHPFL